MACGRATIAVLAIGFGLDLLSFVAWSEPVLLPWATAVVLAPIAVLAFIDIRFGIAAVLLELLWGGHGYLLRIPEQGIDLSLRMGLLLVVFAATAWHLRRRATRAELWGTLRTHPARWPALALFTTLVLGLILGLARHPFDRVFFDANAWGFLVLAPAFLLAMPPEKHRISNDDAPQAMQNAKRKMQNCRSESFCIHLSTFIILTGSLYLILRTYILLFAFSHDLGGTWLPLYQWVRDMRFGEVTIFPGAFPRVFLPSMVLLLPAIAIALTRICEWSRIREYANVREDVQNGFSPSSRGGARGGAGQGVRERGWVGESLLSYAVFGGSIGVLVLSLSRSYWLGLVALSIIGAMYWTRRVIRTLQYSNILQNVRMFCRDAFCMIGAIAVMLLLAVVVVRLPYPKPLTTAGIGSTLLSRLSADAAVSNRWQQLGPLRAAIGEHLIFGSGFGAAVTYETKDPRTLASFPDGHYTTTAFEWGYLDDLLERGLIGLLIELWLLTALIWHGIRQNTSPLPAGRGSLWGRGGDVAALAFSLLAIAIVHATSPYLNHPLGIGVLLWLFAAIGSARRETSPLPARFVRIVT